MNKRYFVFSIFVLLIGLIAVGCGGGGGGSNPVAVSSTSAAVADLSGVVKLANVPLANAKVFLYPSSSAYMAGISQLSSVRASAVAQAMGSDGSYSTTTDNLGQYSFKNVPVGEYTLIAAKDQTHQFAQTGVILGAVTQLDAQLTPTGAVSGVVQIGSENVAGAIVYLDGTSYVAVTGVNGAFNIANVPANQSFSLKVVSSRGVPSTSPTVTITPGQTVSAGTITLAAPTIQTATITGQITISGVTAPDPALANHMVILTSNNIAPLMNFTDNNGNFSFLVNKAGAYKVSPVPDDFSANPNFQDVTVALGSTVALSQPFVMTAETMSVDNTVRGFVIKVAKAFNEADEAGVALTLTDGSGVNVSTISAPNGAFSFQVASGTYNLSVGGAYAFETPFTGNPISVVAEVTLPTPLNVVPTNGVYFNVTGVLSKVRMIAGEINNGDVTVFLKSTDPTIQPLVTVTDPGGNFAFKAKAGQYSLQVGGLYVFDSAPPPINLSADYSGSFGIIPNTLFGGSISGIISPATNPDAYEVKLEPVAPATYIDVITAAPNTGEYLFKNVPAGDYNIVVLPAKNGFYGVFGPITVFPGQQQTNVNFATTAVRPLITATTFPDTNTIELTGQRFLSLPVVPANTRVLVDGNVVQRSSGFTLLDATDRADLSNIIPGDHQVVLRKTWTRPLAGTIFTLSSPAFPFFKALGQPTSPSFEVTDTSISLNWKNAIYSQQTEVEFWQGGSQIGATNIVSGNTYEQQGFLPNTTYQVILRNRRGTILSQNLTFNVTTRSSVNYGIQTVQLAGSNSLVGGQLQFFGFEVVNGSYYLAHFNTSTYDIEVRGFAANGTSLGAPALIAAASDAGGGTKWVSMTSSLNRLYFQYIDDNGFARLNSMATTLVSSISRDLPTSNGYAESQLLYANNRLYSLGSYDFSGVHTDLYEFVTPDSDLVSAGAINTIVSDYAPPTALSGIGSVYRSALLTSDSNGLYMCVASSGTNLAFHRMPFSNLTASQTMGGLNLPGATTGAKQFSFGAGKIYAAVDEAAIKKDFFINPGSGYAESKSTLSSRHNFAVDNKDRVWMAEAGNNGKFFVQLSPDGINVEKSLKVSDFPRTTGAFPEPPDPLEIIKRDRSNNSMHFIYVDAAGFLSVYRYDSSY